MRKSRILLLTMTACTAALLAAGSYNVHATEHDNWDHHGDRDHDDNRDPRIARGFRIAPVPLTYDRDNHEKRELVGLGSYLVNAVGGCNDCHTQPSYAPGHDPFMGQPKQVNTAHYLAGGQPFGPFTSRNLTPENGRPAGRTFAQFKLQLRTGIDLDHQHPQFGPLLQVMPWPTYQDMTDHDIRAIYEYLKAIPPAVPGS
jgi:hypothetical protein